MIRLTLKLATLRDCEACSRLISETPELIRGNGEYPTSKWIKSFLSDRGIFHLVKSNKKVIGLIIGEELVCNGAIVHLFAVNKKFRGHGIGRLLIESFESECVKRNIRWILLYGYEKNKKTTKFFEQNGYTKGSSVVEFEKSFSPKT